MKRPFSPLVWLCAASAIALGVLTVYDPAGVYAGYAASLEAGTPPIAAVFTAVQDGVYPWSVPAAPAETPPDPPYRLLTDTVTTEEMYSSVGNKEPFSDGAAEEGSAADGAAAEVTPSVEIVYSAPEQEERDAPVEDASEGFIPVDESWFDDALFIGDSHIEGFADYAGLRNATFYYKRGLDIWSVMKKAVVNGKQTIPQALSTRRFAKIYIMLGINEIGCGTTESYAEQYASVVAQLRELQPDALIYIQSIFHTSQKKSDTTVYNNDTINARNEAISRIADGEHVFYLDCNAVFDDENGALTPAYSGDGVHVKAPYYTMWRDYLFQFGRVLPEPAEPPEQAEADAPAAQSPAASGAAASATESAPAIEPVSGFSVSADGGMEKNGFAVEKTA